MGKKAKLLDPRRPCSYNNNSVCSFQFGRLQDALALRNTVIMGGRCRFGAVIAEGMQVQFAPHWRPVCGQPKAEAIC